MNEHKLKQIFDAARKEPSPSPASGFEARVLRAIHRGDPAEAVSLFDQLNLLFPRVVWAAATVIALCAAGEFASSALHLPGLTDGLAQISDQWIFEVN